MAGMDMYDAIIKCLRERTAMEPQVGIICGSGLGGIPEVLTETVTVKYQDIPGWPQSAVKGHANELVFGIMHGTVKVVCMRGRFHGYEGIEYSKLGIGVRVMKLLGVKLLLVTAAAGGINRDYSIGDIMVINDHISFPCMAGFNPLVGPVDPRFGTRFTPVSDLYDPKLIEHMHKCAGQIGLSKLMRTGNYTQVSGPNYESRGEIKMLRIVGGDAVGMSTVPEVLVAAGCGMKVLGLCMITNIAVLPGEDLPPANHAEVVDVVNMRTKDVQNLVSRFLKDALDFVPEDVPKVPDSPAKRPRSHSGCAQITHDRL
mmetsp:Transcript_113644/g.185207  ORF Transcript_113644/g.185207 Transcript_113644/m.185207 type:complete len:314 (+) Transcript_113644:75-1016(+)